MKSFAFVSALSLALLGLAPMSRATLLIDPSGGTSIAALFGDPDDGSLLRPLGGNFSLYGTSVSSLYIQTNGFLSVGDGMDLPDDRSVGSLASAIPSSTIAPFYDDLYLDTSLGDDIREGVTSSYYAVSFAISGLNDTTAGYESVFQSALITAPTTLQGNALLAGDIVLSYGALASTVSGNNFSVGVAASSTNATNAFGATGGQFATATSFLSNFNSATQALLFRYDPTSGAYVQSLITYRANPTPEPATFAALGLGAVAVLRRRRR